MKERGEVGRKGEWEQKGTRGERGKKVDEKRRVGGGGGRGRERREVR